MPCPACNDRVILGHVEKMKTRGGRARWGMAGIRLSRQCAAAAAIAAQLCYGPPAAVAAAHFHLKGAEYAESARTPAKRIAPLECARTFVTVFLELPAKPRAYITRHAPPSLPFPQQKAFFYSEHPSVYTFCQPRKYPKLPRTYGLAASLQRASSRWRQRSRLPRLVLIWALPTAAWASGSMTGEAALVRDPPCSFASRAAQPPGPMHHARKFFHWHCIAAFL